MPRAGKRAPVSPHQQRRWQYRRLRPGRKLQKPSLSARVEAAFSPNGARFALPRKTRRPCRCVPKPVAWDSLFVTLRPFHRAIEKGIAFWHKRAKEAAGTIGPCPLWPRFCPNEGSSPKKGFKPCSRAVPFIHMRREQSPRCGDGGRRAPRPLSTPSPVRKTQPPTSLPPRTGERNPSRSTTHYGNRA